MSAPRAYDAIVFGGGTNGLVAASYLAEAGKNVLLLEADKTDGLGIAAVPGVLLQAPTLCALDPLVVRDLKLTKRGLNFASRDLALTGLRRDGKQIVISRDIHATATSIASHSQRDAEMWPNFRKELFALARAMRPLWWEARGALPGGDEGKELERIARMGASAWLDSWFESDALKAMLCFDSIAGGCSVLEPGSALALVWRAAQEMSGLQGAMSLLERAAMLSEALTAAAQEAGCEFRAGARVERIILDGDRAAGVQLQSGETCFAPMVFSAESSFCAHLRLLPTAALGIARSKTSDKLSPLAEARLVLTLRQPLQMGNAAATPASRFVLAERPETYIAAEMAARAGSIPDEPPIELTVLPTGNTDSASAGRHELSALVRPLPSDPAGGWPRLAATLAARVVKSLEAFVPGISRDLLNIEILRPDDVQPASHLSVPHMLMTAVDRVETPIKGLYFCGVDAEAVPAVSGRAARIAVASALKVRS